MADLLVVTDDENSLAEVERYERHDVTLTRFIDDDNVEARGTRIEILDHSGKWHHPNRDSAAHSDIFRVASALSRETRIPWPLPIRRIVSSHPTSAWRWREEVRRAWADHARLSMSPTVERRNCSPSFSLF